MTPKKKPTPKRSTAASRRKAKAAAEEFIEQAKTEAKTPVKKNGSKWAHITKEDILRERDEKGLSWRDVGKALGLGSPGTARAAYSALTGSSHKTSTMTGRRAPRGSGDRKSVMRSPKWTVNTDFQEIVDAILGNMIIVQRKPIESRVSPGVWYAPEELEEVWVAKVLKDNYDDPDRPAVEFISGRYIWDSKSREWHMDQTKPGFGQQRCVFVDEIVEVR